MKISYKMYQTNRIIIYTVDDNFHGRKEHDKREKLTEQRLNNWTSNTGLDANQKERIKVFQSRFKRYSFS